MGKIDTAYQSFCKKRFSLPSDSLVAELERKMGVVLPPDYRRFLLDYNGGYFTEPDIVPPSEDFPLDCLTFLSGIGASHRSAELGKGLPPDLFDDNDPPQILPIGYTLMGNLLFLITHPEDNGSIGLKKAHSDKSFFLANGIEEFFGLLREPSKE